MWINTINRAAPGGTKVEGHSTGNTAPLLAQTAH